MNYSVSKCLYLIWLIWIFKPFLAELQCAFLPKYRQDCDTKNRYRVFSLFSLFSCYPWGEGKAISEASKPEHLILYYSEGLSKTGRGSLNLHCTCPGHNKWPVQNSVKKQGLPRHTRVTQQVNNYTFHSSSTTDNCLIFSMLYVSWVNK